MSSRISRAASHDNPGAPASIHLSLPHPAAQREATGRLLDLPIR
jgi:hypothetical protein